MQVRDTERQRRCQADLQIRLDIVCTETVEKFSAFFADVSAPYVLGLDFFGCDKALS